MLVKMNCANGGGVRVYEELLTVTTNGAFEITCGFTPRIIIMEQETGGTSWMQMTYNSDINPNIIAQTYYYNSGSTKVVTIYDWTQTAHGSNMIYAVTNTGFNGNIGSQTGTEFNGIYHITCIE